MNQRGYFQVGMKLIGLYFVAYSLIALLGSVSTVISFVSSNKEADKFGIHYFLSIVSPMLLMAIALYLLRSLKFLPRIAFPNSDTAPSENLAGYFTIGTKLYGAFVAVGAMPTFLKSLANFLFVANQDSPHAGVAAWATGLRINFAPELAVIIFGIFLFLRGELLTRWAFPSPETDMTAGD